jgi:hypothetical protein
MGGLTVDFGILTVSVSRVVESSGIATYLVEFFGFAIQAVEDVGIFFVVSHD